ncbi:MAG: 5'/3'-nucleotidase SurE [Ignavibacteria bacterium]|nr:5'/3'-nucleotidase SurE [Ignavibacteria bacterium]
MKPTILISNDDGIESQGIIRLAKEIKKFATVIVAAPHTQQSAVGHSITMSNPIRMSKIFYNKEFFGYAVEGTPADAVKLAVHNLLKEKKIDLLISGINQGANTAINIIYSGTVSAAAEGTILGIPSIAVSLASYIYKNFDAAAEVASKIAKAVLKYGLPTGTLLNVNVPPVPKSKIRGIVITKQGKSYWNDVYEKRIDPNNREYYWLTGYMVKTDKGLEYDVSAVEKNYVSVTPIHYDLTDYKTYEKMKSWKLKL